MNPKIVYEATNDITPFSLPFIIFCLFLILALIIGLIIGSFIKKVCGDDASISKFIYEGSVTNILNALYSM